MVVIRLSTARGQMFSQQALFFTSWNSVMTSQEDKHGEETTWESSLSGTREQKSDRRPKPGARAERRRGSGGDELRRLEGSSFIEHETRAGQRQKVAPPNSVQKGVKCVFLMAAMRLNALKVVFYHMFCFSRRRFSHRLHLIQQTAFPGRVKQLYWCDQTLFCVLSARFRFILYV